MPIRHGLTLGELARLFNGENKIGADLTVVPLKNWKRDGWFDETGLPWINPSPNMRNLIQATLYPGIGAIEGTNISVGRGTDTPFEQVGAPWIDGVQLADALNAASAARHPVLPGALHADVQQVRQGSLSGRVHDRHRSRRRCVRSGSASRSRRRCTSCTARSTSSKPPSGCSDRRTVIARIRAGDDPAAIAASWGAAEARWRLLRAKYLLYR